MLELVDVTILPVPKGQRLANAIGFLAGHAVGEAEGRGLKTPAFWWRQGHPEPFPGRDVKVRAASGELAVGMATASGKTRALAWRVGTHLDLQPIELHPEGFIASYAMACGGDAQVGTGTRKLGKGPALDVGLVWRGAAQGAEVLTVEGDELVLLGTDGVTHVGGVGARAALWRDGRATLIGPQGRHTIAVGTRDGEQVGELWTGLGPRAVMWRGSESSLVDLHPGGFESSQGTACADGLQVGFASRKALSSAGNCAMLWAGSAESALDLHALVPPTWNVSRARSLDVQGDAVRIAGCVERVESDGGSSSVAARQACVWLVRRS